MQSMFSIRRGLFTICSNLIKQPNHLKYSIVRNHLQNVHTFSYNYDQICAKRSGYTLIRIPYRQLTNCIKRSNSSGSNNSGSPQPNNMYIILFIMSSIGVAFYLGYLLTKSRLKTPYDVVPFNAFMKLLERGDVEFIELPRRGSYAQVVLYDVEPSGAKKIILVPAYPSTLLFERSIRTKEDRWGIAANERIPIHHGGESLVQPSLSSLALFIGTVFTTTVAATVLVISLLKRRKLPPPPPPGYPGGDATKSYWRRVTRHRRRNPGEKQQQEDAKDARTSSSSPHSDNLDQDQRYHGTTSSPFSWDPFGGFTSVRPVTTNITFKDVAGLHASKEEVMEFVSYLRDARKFQALGAKLPKGALLLGPPGTGKTLLVKALANEAGVPFFCMAGSEFVEVIGGLGASRIRQLFKTARSNRPAIIFIDELDSLGRRRGSSSSGGPPGGGGGGVSEMEQTLNQLLVEMDGMDTAEGTIVFAATNRADLLDKALLRAGRFDRHIFIDLPNLAERKELVAMYVDKYCLSPQLSKAELIERLSGWTPGMSGADIARLCNEAALIAARRQEDPVVGVTRDDFEMALERVLAGAAKQFNPLSPPEKRVAAVQEAGRALVAWLLPRTGLKPVKVSIVPRTAAGSESGASALGFTQLIPDERKLFTGDELKDRMAVMLGGRAAEQVIFKAVSDASQRYLKEASDLAMKQVRELGLSKVIGNVSFAADSSGSEFITKPYSQRTQAMIEAEAQGLVALAFARCIDLLSANKDKLHALIDALLAHEVVTYDELVRICENQPEIMGSHSVPASGFQDVSTDAVIDSTKAKK